MVIMTNSAGLFYKESSKVGQGLGMNGALMEFRQDIKEANSIVSSYSAGSVVYNSGTNQLILAVPTLDSGGNLVQDAYDHFVYFQDQNILRLKTFPDIRSQRQPKDQVLASAVDKVVFQYYNNNAPPLEVAPNLAVKVKVSLVLNQKIGSVLEQTTATSEANLRND